ncbi:hypothetical protein [Methanobrevibacter sp.]|uniref:hypothetical protein n=1 Tax=Methanobrevibacter sp. TaxID=66852 RepID=UPI00386FF67A
MQNLIFPYYPPSSSFFFAIENSSYVSNPFSYIFLSLSNSSFNELLSCLDSCGSTGMFSGPPFVSPIDINL